MGIKGFIEIDSEGKNFKVATYLVDNEGAKKITPVSFKAGLVCVSRYGDRETIKYIMTEYEFNKKLETFRFGKQIWLEMDDDRVRKLAHLSGKVLKFVKIKCPFEFYLKRAFVFFVFLNKLFIIKIINLNKFMKISTKVILIYSIIASLLLYITENIFHPTYIIQMLQKIISFIVIPILLAKHFSESFGKFGHIQKSSVIYGVSFGLLGAFIIGLTYYFLKDSIEWGAIKESIASRGVNSTTFIFIFTYIMFGNSLVEEFFFRGVVFDSLLKYSKIFAYILSSLLFSLYHFAIFGAWFHGYILVLAFFGLFAGGLFFAWLYQKTKGIWGAYIFHILADLIILIIGYIQLFS